MSTENTPETPLPSTSWPEVQQPPAPLPELSDATIARMQDTIFERIEQIDVNKTARAGRQRKRTAMWGAAAATVLIAGAAIVVPNLTSQPHSGSADMASVASSGGSNEAVDAAAPEAAVDSAARDTLSVAKVETNIITTADLRVRVSNVTDAADEIAKIAAEQGGYVANQELGTRTTYGTKDEAATVEPTFATITIRIPSVDINGSIQALSELGTVESSQISRVDVTQQKVDLQARVESLTTSVARLEELMKQSGSVGDLITAEQALSERQAELESIQQQLDVLKDRVAMSTITIDVSTKTAPVEADPTGFGDGLLAGWNGLIVALNGIVVAIGFVLPWVAIGFIVGFFIWSIVRGVRRSRRNRKNRAVQAQAAARANGTGTPVS